MSGETNLQLLLKSMQPELLPGEYVFCTVQDNRHENLEPVCTFREKEGLSLVVLREKAEKAGLAHTYPCRMITLHVHSSLAAVGFLAEITKKLAQNGISVNPVSAYYHDHLFVPSDKAEQVMQLLKEFAA